MSLVETNWNPTQRQLRQFGAVGFLVFVLLGLRLYFKQSFLGLHFSVQAGHAGGFVLWALAVACGLLALAAPALLRPLFVALTIITYPIGVAVSYAALVVVYYGIFTPVGLVMRLIGRDPLQRRLRPDLSSYWEQ